MSDSDRTLALAGVFQAGCLVRDLARRGSADQDDLRTSVGSLFVREAPDVAGVFGGVGGVRTGLEFLRARFSARAAPEDVEVARYALSLVLLERRLAGESRLQEIVAQRIDDIETTDEEGDVLAEDVIDALAAIYTDTLSLLPPRIMVQGVEGHLSRESVANRVRAALFAGVRAAMLWRQVGGRRWHLVFRRQAYMQGAGRLLEAAG